MSTKNTPTAAELAKHAKNRIYEEILVDYAEGMLNDNPKAIESVKQLLSSDQDALNFLEEYRAIIGSKTAEEWDADARTFCENFSRRMEEHDSRGEDAQNALRPLLAQPELALAAATQSLPMTLDVSHLLPGFLGTACGSVRRPSEATTLRFSKESGNRSSETAVQSRVYATLDGRPCSRSQRFVDKFGRWTVELELDLSWPEAINAIRQGTLLIVTDD